MALHIHSRSERGGGRKDKGIVVFRKGLVREGRNAYGGVCACACVLATGLVLKRACKGEVAPSLASSSPSRK